MTVAFAIPLGLIIYFSVGGLLIASIFGRAGFESVPGVATATRGHGAARGARMFLVALGITLLWPVIVWLHATRAHR